MSRGWTSQRSCSSRKLQTWRVILRVGCARGAIPPSLAVHMRRWLPVATPLHTQVIALHTHTLTRGGCVAGVHCQVLYFGDKKSDTLAKQLQFVESDGRVVDEVTSFCEQCFAVRVISFEAYLEHARSQMQMIPFVYSNEVLARPSLSSKIATLTSCLCRSSTTYHA